MANKLIEGIKSNINIYQVAHIPLMLELICSISKEEEQDFSDLTITDLYKKVVENIFKGHIAKNRDKEISRKERKKVLNILGKLAFEGLKRQRIIFDEDFVEEVLEDEEIEFLEGKAILSGFLKTDKKSEELLDNNLEFIHLTFQEYLSAYYVSNLDKEEIKEIIREYKFYPHMQVFFMFLAGLIDDKNFLIKEVRSEPRDILGFYEILFLMSLLSQIKPEELYKDLFEELKKDLFKWIKFTAKEEIQYEKLLKNLPLIKEYVKVNDEIINKLIDVINNEKIDNWVRRNVAEALANIGRNDDLVFNTLIDFINNENIDSDVRGDVAIALSNIGRNDDLVVNTLIDFINNENIHSDVRGDVAIALAKNLTPNEYQYLKIANKCFKHEFTQYTNTEVVIKAFKENVVDLDFVFLHVIYRVLPLYLKENNILHTIFEGKEIKLKEVSEKEIKEALEKIGLTDYQA
jgi:predicted DNA-binding ribbon-helix-helix protein